MPNTTEDYGPCCICESTTDVRNIWMLNFTVPNLKGWGCFVCQLPATGATAILCDLCAERDWQPTVDGLVALCDGRTSTGRLPLPPPHERIPHLHDLRHHRDETEHVHWFDASPDAASPQCVCSVCGQNFQSDTEPQTPIRTIDDRSHLEARFHPECFTFAVQEGWL